MLLNRRPKFTPNTKSNHFIFKDDSKKFTRRLQIKEIFNDTPFEGNSLVHNPSKKPVKTKNSDLQQLITETEHVDPNYKTFTDNLTKDERASITELTENGNIILKKSDRGGGWVIIDKEYYINHMVSTVI